MRVNPACLDGVAGPRCPEQRERRVRQDAANASPSRTIAFEAAAVVDVGVDGGELPCAAIGGCCQPARRAPAAMRDDMSAQLLENQTAGSSWLTA